MGVAVGSYVELSPLCVITEDNKDWTDSDEEEVEAGKKEAKAPPLQPLQPSRREESKSEEGAGGRVQGGVQELVRLYVRDGLFQRVWCGHV